MDNVKEAYLACIYLQIGPALFSYESMKNNQIVVARVRNRAVLSWPGSQAYCEDVY